VNYYERLVGEIVLSTSYYSFELNFSPIVIFNTLDVVASTRSSAQSILKIIYVSCTVVCFHNCLFFLSDVRETDKILTSAIQVFLFKKSRFPL